MNERRPSYTLQQLIELTGFSRQHFYNECNRGKLRLSKAGGRTVVMAADLDSWMAAFREVRAQSSAA